MELTYTYKVFEQHSRIFFLVESSNKLRVIENRMAHQMLEAKRTSRGKRMASLVGKAVEDDDAFWGNSIWGEEGSDNESFEAEDDQPDEFDSDFNDTETEGEEESEGEDGQDSSKRTKSVSKFCCA